MEPLRKRAPGSGKLEIQFVLTAVTLFAATRLSTAMSSFGERCLTDARVEKACF